MRVCLIIPPSGFLLDERVFMSLGILKVAAVLEQRGFGVEMLDLSGVSNFQTVVADYAQKTDVFTFGITATTPQLPAVTEITRVIRQAKNNARVILGGPHVTLVNSAVKFEKNRKESNRALKSMHQLKKTFDVLVAGDGEEAIFLAVKEESSGLIDADDVGSDLFLTSARLETAPFPARHLIDVGSYHYRIDGVPAMSIIAQLGCPFGCGFCGGRFSPALRKIRTRTSESVVEEMVHLYRTYGVTGFMLYDDELNVNLKMVELMELIAKTQKYLGVDWRLRGFIKAELFNEKQAETMYAAGFRWILVGFESGSSKILANINKNSTLEDNTRCLNVARQAGLKVKALMSVGHPGESEETVFQTRDWLLKVRPDDFDVSIITCYPGTPYYNEAIQTSSGVWVYTHKNGDRLFQFDVDYSTVADYFKGDPDGGYRSYVYTDKLSPADLVRLRGDVEREVRRRLNIPFSSSVPAMLYEHSMGQSGFPSQILKVSK